MLVSKEEVDAKKKYLKELLLQYHFGNREVIALSFENNAYYLIATIAVIDIKCNILYLAPNDKRVQRYNYILSDCDYNQNMLELISKIEFDDGTKLGLFKNTKCYNEKEEESLIYYTSGSSGNPKLVYKKVDAVFLEALTLKKIFKLCEMDILLCVAPCYHGYAQSIACLAAYFAGCKVNYLKNFVPYNRIVKELETQLYTIVVTTSAYYNFILDKLGNVNSVRYYINGGAPIAKKIEMNKGAFCNYYGTTETGGISVHISSIYKDNNVVGKLLPGVNLEILNKVHGTGAFFVSTPYKAYKVIEEKEVAIEKGVLLDDIGLIDRDSNIRLLGRVNEVININGEKVYPMEIEKIIMRHPEIEDVYVYRQYECGQEFPCADIKIRNNNKGLINDIFEYCKEEMQEFMVPRKIKIVSEIYRNAAGKKLLKKLENIS